MADDTAFWIPVAVLAVFAVLRRLVPAKTVPLPASVDLEGLARRYRWWDIGALVPFFVFAPALGYVWFLVLRVLATLFLPSPQDVRYLIVPQDNFWALPAIFLGIVSAILPMDLVYRRLLGERYAEYQAYSRGRVGFDAERVMKWLTGSVAVVAIGFLLGGINSATVFDDRGITTGRLWGGGGQGGFHSYGEVKAIEAREYFTAPNGNRIHRPHFVVRFSDGGSWSTRGLFRSPIPESDNEIMGFVAEQAGLSFTLDDEEP